MRAEEIKDNENSIISVFFESIISPLIKKTVEETLVQHHLKRDDITEDDEIGVVEAAKLLRCSEGNIYNLSYKCKIPSYKKGKELLFSRTSLKEWDESRRKNRYHTTYQK